MQANHNCDSAKTIKKGTLYLKKARKKYAEENYCLSEPGRRVKTKESRVRTLRETC
jgi:hypothetical protein